MRSLDLNAIGEEVEKRIPKQCKTCMENFHCKNAEKEIICNQWKPEFMLFQETWEEVTKEMGIDIK